MRRAHLRSNPLGEFALPAVGHRARPAEGNDEGRGYEHGERDGKRYGHARLHHKVSTVDTGAGLPRWKPCP
jgi:hypothetical protein